MTSNKPYFIRAVYDWIVDNELTPYLLVNADYPGIDVPAGFVNDSRIVLNISPVACRGLHLDNDRIIFTARFAGKTEQIVLLPQAVLAIYAKENGRGMEFADDFEPPPTPLANDTNKARARPKLKLIKQDKES